MSKRRRSEVLSESTQDAPWQVVQDASSDDGVIKAVREVEAFWSHGRVVASQIVCANVRCRGKRKTKVNTDYQIDVLVDEVVYRAAVKGKGNPKIRCPVAGRIWVTQPCVVCEKDDNEDMLLLCGTDESEAKVKGCNRSHHTFCVGLDKVPDDDWFCERCEMQRTRC
mmetsp:Transcript_13210/g.25251  ORF Transcript_13210/g.25251 Transcript_13210/m.25251 type:complete len:167 (+) Transcript_13210:247-747(+)